jgi:hypothetical protein
MGKPEEKKTLDEKEEKRREKNSLSFSFDIINLLLIISRRLTF